MRDLKIVMVFAGITIMLGLQAAPVEKPNILWLTCEDNNTTYLGCYGNEFAKTPNIDKLASEGFRYTNVYSNGAVCSASRSSWITGMISSSTGLLNHRSGKDIPSDVKLYPVALKEAGYYVINDVKDF
ncbi:MAG: sulfatase-like hydrolase/transferase [Planctomycetes bacterium]|nr:sulfatase-like hydrolase/transferase [Planctomycetota bacterium]